MNSQLLTDVLAGDVDATVTGLGTQAWIGSLQQEVQEPWKPIYNETNDVRVGGGCFGDE